MKRLIISLTTVVVFLFFFVSCYYDSEEALYPALSTSCDTSNVTFSGTIVPILDNNCFSCHSNNTAASNGNNIRLQNYADVLAKTDRIVGSIKHLNTFSPMPKSGGMIKSCSITQFDIWVRKGMLNN
jgi:hypothetical protein